MIKFSVMYPYAADARFDHEYYRTTHMPMLKARLGDACLSYTIDRGLTGRAPGSPPAYVAMCHVLCESFETFQKAFEPHAKEIRNDLQNYTDIVPVTQFSEVVVG